jgi:fructose-1,6-bisphosphatase/inositol monophosphatase family enzyme
LPVPDDFAALLEPLCYVASEAAEIALSERENLIREIKPDGSIVTSADKKVELMLREELPKLIPGSAFWGEEFGHESDQGNGVWLVDPIDGTSNFSYGSPLWGVSIAYGRAGVIELGCVLIPDFNEIYLGARGVGAFLNGEPMPPIPAGPVRPEELVSFNDSVDRVMNRSAIPGKRREHGAFVIAGTFVATQRLRGLIAVKEKLYDVAACALFCQELGAEVRWADGGALDFAPYFDDRKFEKPWLIFPAGSEFVYPAS